MNAVLRACLTCGRLNCQAHSSRRAWQHEQQRPRIRGRRLQALRFDLFEQFPSCVLCQVNVSAIRDHVIPLAEGGLDVASNVQAICQACSDVKTAAEAQRGLERRRWGGM